jgi:hypothetical protein
VGGWWGFAFVLTDDKNDLSGHQKKKKKKFQVVTNKRVKAKKCYSTSAF